MDRNTPYIKAMSLIGLEEALARHGLSAKALLQEVGVPLEALRKPDMLIDFRAYARIYAIAVKRTGSNALAMFGNDGGPHFQNMGAVSILSHFAPSFADWIELAIRYWHLQMTGGIYRIYRNAETGDLTIRGHVQSACLPAREVIEGAAFNNLKVARHVNGLSDLKPLAATFQHTAPDGAHAYDGFFGCAVEWGQAYNELTFSKADVEIPIGGRLALLRPALDAYVRFRARKSPELDRTISSRVSLTIPLFLGTGKCNANVVAESIGFT